MSLHGLTLHELANPANAHHVSALDALRQKVMASLPERIRGVLGDMRVSGTGGIPRVMRSGKSIRSPLGEAID